ncbi:MAG: VWA domain-containing protein, partial [Verrucomicrobiota bacterium]
MTDPDFSKAEDPADSFIDAALRQEAKLDTVKLLDRLEGAIDEAVSVPSPQKIRNRHLLLASCAAACLFFLLLVLPLNTIEVGDSESPTEPMLLSSLDWEGESFLETQSIAALTRIDPTTHPISIDPIHLNSSTVHRGEITVTQSGTGGQTIRIDGDFQGSNPDPVDNTDNLIAQSTTIPRSDYAATPPVYVEPKAPIEECVDIGGLISAGYETDYVFYGSRIRPQSQDAPGLGYDFGVTTRAATLPAPSSSSSAVASGLTMFSSIEKPIAPGNDVPSTESISPTRSSLADNAWKSPREEPLSTFSIDVDTASYTQLRGMIRSGANLDSLPGDAIRIEELINYFDYSYPQPDGEHPFAFANEYAVSPWDPSRRLLRIAIQAEDLNPTDRPDANLVFLLDVSGSMNQTAKLPLVKRALSVLVDTLEERDRIAIVVYAGAEGIVLEPTSGDQHPAIHAAIDRLSAGGSTNGGAGIELAYKVARSQFLEEGVNRVILCTDGDFNVGITDQEALVSLVEKEAEAGVQLSVLGFGQDNLNDAMLEAITNRGEGTYYFIDQFREARKVFLEDLTGTLVNVARDVKFQIEFNPAAVAEYRLVGYANRLLAAEDFDNDEIDAGEVGAGHTVTAFYEILPTTNRELTSLPEAELRYQVRAILTEIPEGNPSELAYLKLRYKRPGEEQSVLVDAAIANQASSLAESSDDFRFAA